MTLRTTLESIFLAAAIVSGVMSSIGMLRSRNAYAAVHTLNLGSICVPLFLLLAVAAAKLGSEATIKMFIVAAVQWVSGPIVGHAILRADRERSKRS